MWRVRRSLCESRFSALSQARRSGQGIYDWDCLLLWLKMSRLPLSGASFDAITFIGSVKHILTETAVLRTVMSTLCSEWSDRTDQSDPHDRNFGMPGYSWDKDQRKRDMTGCEVFRFTHRELMAPMTRAGIKRHPGSSPLRVA